MSQAHPGLDHQWRGAINHRLQQQILFCGKRCEAGQGSGCSWKYGFQFREYAMAQRITPQTDIIVRGVDDRRESAPAQERDDFRPWFSQEGPPKS
jgi:hypothetical protein